MGVGVVVVQAGGVLPAGRLEPEGGVGRHRRHPRMSHQGADRSGRHFRHETVDELEVAGHETTERIDGPLGSVAGARVLAHDHRDQIAGCREGRRCHQRHRHEQRHQQDEAPEGLRPLASGFETGGHGSSFATVGRSADGRKGWESTWPIPC